MPLLEDRYYNNQEPDELEAALQEAYEAGINDGYNEVLNELGNKTFGKVLQRASDSKSLFNRFFARPSTYEDHQQARNDMINFSNKHMKPDDRVNQYTHRTLVSRYFGDYNDRAIKVAKKLRRHNERMGRPITDRTDPDQFHWYNK